jgi:hypothetical protein
MRTLRAIIISIESHPDMKFEIFERLNTGAVSLNAQELRNSIYRGSFNDLLRSLAKDPTFRGLIGTKAPRARMVDEELILRFFALHSRLENYKTPLKRFLNDFMRDFCNLAAEQIAELQALFNHAVSTAHELLGSTAFRNLDSQGRPLDASVNRALFDAQTLACSWITNRGNATRAKTTREIGALFGNEAFLDSIQRATGDRSRTITRLRETAVALKRAGADVIVPFDLAR